MHVIIQALMKGWHETNQEFELDPQWKYFEQVDAQMVACGHPRVARLASIFVFRLITKVR